MLLLMPDITCGWEKLEDLLAEPNIRDLLEAQWEELAGLKDKIALDPDIKRMRQAEALGVFKIWAGRRDGLLVGFIEWHVSPTFHNRSTLYAIDGGHYCHPEFCDSWSYLHMWREAERALRDMGVGAFMAHDNEARPMPAFFRRLGYQPQGRLYGKVA